jgi:hypothetical protein
MCAVCGLPNAPASSSSVGDHQEEEMAGTLEVTEDLCWMPAGWVFDHVLKRMAIVLHAKDPALAELLLASRTEANGGYLDLRAMDLETLGMLLDVANIVYGHIEREGAQGFARPEFYEGFLTQFQQLRELLHAGQQARLGQR